MSAKFPRGGEQDLFSSKSICVLWVGLQCVSVVFPGHTHLLFHHYMYIYLNYLDNNSYKRVK